MLNALRLGNLNAAVLEKFATLRGDSLRGQVRAHGIVSYTK